MNDKDKKLGGLEALLFVYGEPLPRKKAQKLLDIKEEDLADLLAELEQNLSDSKRGLTLVKEGGKVQLATKPEFGKLLEDFAKNELSEDLTPASLEVLSLIAYLGPIPRSEIDYRRGVNSSFTLRNLLLRGLVEKIPDSKNPGSYLYKPSFDLLKHLGVGSREDLPEYGKFAELLKISEPSGTKTE